MSETPRLSRRELRELGKLQARPADAQSLTETSELKLRRPSRKELREAQKAESAAVETDAADVEKTDEAAVAESPVESQVVPEDPTGQISANSTSADASDQSDDVEATDADVTGDETEPVGDDTVADEATEQPERTSVFDRFYEDVEASATEESTSADADKSHDDARASGEAEFDQVLESDDSDDSSAAAGVAAAGTSTHVPLRERLREMTRRGRGEDKPADNVAEEPVVEDEVKDAEVTEAEAVDTEDAEVTGVNRTSVMDSTEDVEYVAEDGADEDESESEKTTAMAPTAATAVGSYESADDYYADDEDEVTPRRTILNYILLILIAVLVGLLVGMWINNSFLSAGPAVTDVVTETAARLL